MHAPSQCRHSACGKPGEQFLSTARTPAGRPQFRAAGGRRRFLRRLTAATLAIAPLAAWLPAQAQGRPARIAWISPTKAADGSRFLDELRSGFRELGLLEGRDIQIEAHWGEDSPPQLQQIIAQVVASAPALIVTQGAASPLMRKATERIPVVFGYSGDPVEAGMVQSFARPGGNLTGISFMALELVGKRLELLREVLPQLKRIAVVANPQHPGDQAERRATLAAAAALGLNAEVFEAVGAGALLKTLATIERSRFQAVLLFPYQAVINARQEIAEWSLRTRIPVMSGWAQFAEGGNFMTYGANLQESCRRLAFFADRILKGTRPADLPVELPRQVELVINQKTARALGINVPRAVLLRADRVIQ